MSVHPAIALLEEASLVEHRGTILGVGQSGLEASGPLCSVGDFCRVDTSRNGDLLAEVVAIESDRIRLLPMARPERVRVGASVRLAPELSSLKAGDGFAGRAIDAFGHPIDGAGPVRDVQRVVARGMLPGKLDRVIVPQRVATGIRAIDGLLPLAKGQRIGIFSASGVGKTSLVEQISRSIDCDHCVLCLIGERGREVERMWQLHAEDARRKRLTLVAATAEESATARIRALDHALAVSEHWRAAGKHVVLFVDSVTRLAMALREVGLASGEPPTLRSYTPNVFSAMPHYVERCGADRKSGAITAIFTVLAETDDVDDPIVELMKSLLDGHVVLSRRLADRGYFPAIDVGASVSRIADELLDRRTLAAARGVRKAFAVCEEARPMIESGIYRPGSNAEIDRAVALQPGLAAFLVQSADEGTSLGEIDQALEVLAQRAAQ
jgi:flagellum-specific ATP synthase